MKYILLVSMIAQLTVVVGTQVSKPEKTDHTVDLVPYRNVPVIERALVLRGPARDGRRRPEMSVTLLPLNRNDFEWGDEFEYEIVVRNVGQLPLILPASVDGVVLAEAPNEEVPIQGGSITIDVWSNEGEEKLASLSSMRIAGSVAMPGSLRRLAPNQTVLLRVPASWSSFQSDGIGRILARRQVRISASVYLYDGSILATSAKSPVVNVVGR